MKRDRVIIILTLIVVVFFQFDGWAKISMYNIIELVLNKLELDKNKCPYSLEIYEPTDENRYWLLVCDTLPIAANMWFNDVYFTIHENEDEILVTQQARNSILDKMSDHVRSYGLNELLSTDSEYYAAKKVKEKFYNNDNNISILCTPLKVEDNYSRRFVAVRQDNHEIYYSFNVNESNEESIELVQDLSTQALTEFQLVIDSIGIPVVYSSYSTDIMCIPSDNFLEGDILNLHGIRVETEGKARKLSPGIYIVRKNGKWVKILR